MFSYLWETKPTIHCERCAEAEELVHSQKPNQLHFLAALRNSLLRQFVLSTFKAKAGCNFESKKSFSELLHFIIEQSHSFESIGWFGLWTQIYLFFYDQREVILFSKRNHSNWSKIGRSGWPESRSESDGFLAFVPRHKVGWSVGGAQCCFHLSFGNFNAMPAAPLLSWPSFVGISKKKLWSLRKIYLRWYIYIFIVG